MVLALAGERITMLFKVVAWESMTQQCVCVFNRTQQRAILRPVPRITPQDPPLPAIASVDMCSSSYSPKPFFARPAAISTGGEVAWRPSELKLHVHVRHRSCPTPTPFGAFGREPRHQLLIATRPP